MVRRIAYTIIICLVTVNLWGQCCGAKQKMNQKITASAFWLYYAKYEGVPFFINDWSNTSLTLISGETYDDLKVKYDLYKQNFVYYNNKINKLLVVDNQIIDEVVMHTEDGMPYRFINYRKNNSESKFYEVYYTDSISLWCDHKKKIEKYNDISRSTTYLGAFYAIEKKLIKVNNTFTSLPKTKRALAGLFPTNKKQIIAFINKNSLTIKSKGDLISVFKKINELEKDNPSVYVDYPGWKFWK